ncbi:DUF4118 domain-containing protein [Arthrobacter sp. OVS8]|nr:DUF4118 domain-containing protein [Arthrobacter sp. OVS8]
MARGTLRIFLGAAPGVGKTYEMLEEAHRLGKRGEDVVVAFAMDHGRSETRALLEGLEIIPPRRIPYRGTEFEEMDLDAVLARAPGTAIVDEYAHSNIPGSRNPKRWQDVDELLDAGIDVLSTVNIQHLASLGDVVSAITDVHQAETVPDDVVRRADQIHLVDISPELLRQRLGDGKIYAPRKSTRHSRTTSGWATSPRCGAGPAVAGRPCGRRPRQIPGGAGYRGKLACPGTDCGGPDGRPRRRGPDPPRRQDPQPRQRRRPAGGPRAGRGRGRQRIPQALEAQRHLIQDLGGSYHIVTGEDPAGALLDFARSVNATQIVVGISRRKKISALLGNLLGGGVGTRVVRDSGDIDVHMVSHPLGGHGTRPSRQRDLGRVRVTLGFILAMLLPAVLQLLLLALNPDQNIATAVLVQLSGSVAVALIGGLWPAILAALWSSLLVNYFSTPPVGTLTISDPQNLLALLVFVGVSAAVAVVVDMSARRSKEAARARAEATTLGDLARSASGADDMVRALLEQALGVFQVRGAAIFSLIDSPGDGGPLPPTGGSGACLPQPGTLPRAKPNGAAPTARTSKRSTPRRASCCSAGSCRRATGVCWGLSASI